MQPQDPPFRRPRNWNVLHALESVIPPSPSATGSLGSFDALASLASSGEIPIFLHTSSGRDTRSSVISVSTGDRSRRSSANFLRPSSSMATFHSTNTFGHPHTARSQVQNLNPEVVTPDDASGRTTRRSSSFLTPSPSSSRLSVRPSCGGGYWSNRFSSVSDLSPMAVSAYLDSCASGDHLVSSADSAGSGFARPSPSVPYSICTSDSIVISPTEHAAHSSSYPAQADFDAFKFPPQHAPEADSPVKRLASAPSHSWSSLSSALFARRSISPSPSIISEDFNVPPTIRFRSPLLRNTHLPPSPKRMNTSQATRGASPAPSNNKLCEPSTTTTSPGIDLRDCPSLTYTPPDSDPPLNSRKASDFSAVPHLHSHKDAELVTNVPGVLDWLRSICIELWIDQEGFRAIRPKFRLVGYTPGSPAPSSFAPGNELVDVFTHGMAHFRPVRHETSAYHHGTLDSNPVLRRLTRADSEDKDYISRQASLTIKANGVYVVTGTESYEDHPFTPANLAHVAGNLLNLGSDHADPVQLQWRFEYAVEDRKTDTGRLMPGEKTFTPLSFSCSPGLLHHSHGKRIRLMHVLVKTFTPKISAERVVARRQTEEADPTKKLYRTQSASQSPRVARATTVRRSLPGSIHRRVRSSEPSRTSWSPATDGPDDAGVNHRNRPASLSGMSRQQPVMEGTVVQAAGLQTCYRSNTIVSTAASSRLSRQILSREELAAILASFPAPTEAQRLTAASPIRPLSPPSYYSHRRAPSSLDRVDELGVVLSRQLRT